MLTLETRVLDLMADGYFRPAGHYICPVFPEEILGRTLDENAQVVDIMGGGSYEADMGRELIEIIPRGREATTNTAVVDYQTEVAVLNGNEILDWVPACSLSPRYHCIIVPEIRGSHWFLMPAQFNIKRYRSTPERYANGVQPTMCRLQLRDRKKYFTTLGGVVSTILAGEQ